MNSRLKVIDTQIAKGRQSVDFTQVEEKGEHRLRISIKSDSYAFQCYARISRWNGTKWEQVHSIHHNLMTTQSGLTYKPNGTNHDNFVADARQLRKVAHKIVGV